VTRRIALYSGSFNPPGSYCREAAQHLCEQFDEVVVVPCGNRPDAPLVDKIPPVHRAFLADLTFKNIPKVRVDLDYLEEKRIVSNPELARDFASLGEVSIVASYERIIGRNGTPSEFRQDEAGERMWNEYHFIVIHPEDDDLSEEVLPPKHTLLSVKNHVTSEYLRSRAANGQSIADSVLPEVHRYIQRHGLYSGAPLRETHLRLEAPRLKLVFDRNNPRSSQLLTQLQPFESDDPEMIVVLGGDGTMLHAIREYWKLRLPFYGLNTGHLGFLLNEAVIDEFWQQNLRLYHLPLLWVQVADLDGNMREVLAFNDAWVERVEGQTAWINVEINGETRISKVVADGMLVATAAGSTSYARAMGATPLLFNTQALTLVGSNIMHPHGWGPAVLPIDTEIKLSNVAKELKKRPLQAFADGVNLGRISWMKVRVSNVAAIEVAFKPSHDPILKLLQLQFDASMADL
jgi:NAD kinase